jgi:hypothetical protein
MLRKPLDSLDLITERYCSRNVMFQQSFGLDIGPFP